MSVLVMRSVFKSYRAGAAGCSARASVLHDLDLALWPGEIVAIDGGSGCGKSTLLQCAAGLLSPDSGTIHWRGARMPQRDVVAFVTGAPARRWPDSLRDQGGGRAESGALYAALRAIPTQARLIVVDNLSATGALERRLALALLRDYSRSGAAIVLSANEELASAPFVSRVLTLADGSLLQRRKRSAARIAASSPASRARASARSTYGRSLRSPQ
ncbi:MAG TPA: ATP-binding cassette domain-containing protein [Gemmatimonadaceae bacterium]|nr:ATP-binding cassette domain-containing protein [Gemmatimonadaceae bacterium]